MRILLVLLVFNLCLNFAFASEEAEIKQLFDKYQMIVDEHKVELMEDVFTKKFIQGNGGKEEYSKTIKSESIQKNKLNKSFKDMLSWRKGLKGNMYFAKIKPENNKAKDHDSESQFIIIKEDGKLKIDGNISDIE